jgi:hypothetical protein
VRIYSHRDEPPSADLALRLPSIAGLSRAEERIAGSSGDRAFDAVDRGIAVLAADTPTAVLRPDFANVHAFQAQTAAALLDVVMPPYDERAGRDCHYLALLDRGPSSEERPPQLRVVAPPPTLEIGRGDDCRAPGIPWQPPRCSSM